MQHHQSLDTVKVSKAETCRSSRALSLAIRRKKAFASRGGAEQVLGTSFEF